jgi:uncharacterized membrane protein (Fun14 family)
VDSGAPASGLAAGSSSTAEPAPGESGASGWSPFFLKNGFSFLAAFCVGYAARVWLGITFTVLGTILIAVFALSYFEVITVDWSTIGDVWGGLARRLGEELSDFRGFVTGSLPQAGSASVGLVAGFKMR